MIPHTAKANTAPIADENTKEALLGKALSRADLTCSLGAAAQLHVPLQVNVPAERTAVKVRPRPV